MKRYLIEPSLFVITVVDSICNYQHSALLVFLDTQVEHISHLVLQSSRDMGLILASEAVDRSGVRVDLSYGLYFPLYGEGGDYENWSREIKEAWITELSLGPQAPWRNAQSVVNFT